MQKKYIKLNNNKNLILITTKLYNITKNDKTIQNTFIEKLNPIIINNNYYETITENLLEKNN